MASSTFCSEVNPNLNPNNSFSSVGHYTLKSSIKSTNKRIKQFTWRCFEDSHTSLEGQHFTHYCGIQGVKAVIAHRSPLPIKLYLHSAPTRSAH